MEYLGSMSEGEWNSLNGMFSDEAEFMAQLLSNCSLPNEVQNGSNFLVSSAFWQSNGNNSGVDEGLMYSSDETIASLCSFPQGSSSYESYNPSVSHQVYVTNNNMMTMDYNSAHIHILSTNVMEGDDFLTQDVSNDSMESNKSVSEDVIQGKNLPPGADLAIPTPEVRKEEKASSPLESKKRSSVPGEVQRNKRNTKPKKCLKLDENDEDNNNNNNAVLHRQTSSSCCSEDDSNVSHELNGLASSSSSKGSGALNLSGKTRASRGSATDPQSLYARKRRERINERLRILQNLVPNGTKLLSSDELWMYAPIAYNGMDIGLDLKISTPKAQS
ncbi:hypothetical protein CDL12_17226 [Handroanthus impetiginosus]|uniref:BHLH domain-containing protein n=1 Tax=Handroanthus impetiginosus TaxID=429701 RepID=A0A2G9GY67_9LAMI|nr:hypothetical protein CDL12_17226 [Handroanthus impetiginosus]